MLDRRMVGASVAITYIDGTRQTFDYETRRDAGQAFQRIIERASEETARVAAFDDRYNVIKVVERRADGAWYRTL